MLKRAVDFLSYNLRRPHNNGHGIHSPFLFDFVTKAVYVKVSEHHKVSGIEKFRNKLLESDEIIKIEEFGAGSGRLAHRERKICDIVRISSTTPKYGQLLYRIAGYFKPSVILELGTCLGLGTMYLASGNENAKIFTIEGSKKLMQKAQENFRHNNFTNIIARQGNFDEVLPVLLNEIGKIDLLFIDGNHRKDATLQYFNTCIPYLHKDSVVIFDDIRWSDEMFEAWLDICGNTKVFLSLDFFRMGVVFLKDKLKKQHFEIFY
jgi:predicted O-methyltransferase YrrM